ncbi:dihydropteroate synthase [Aquipuribacter nitratireducens]|uniref:Dihydropteroate synthase n=1 Tax=Aquipuribacter nitratireducens TaxID=650104 RepID=A0ABW0GP39_9MICO
MARTDAARPGAPTDAALLLGHRAFPHGRTVVMAVLNRTPDSFYPGARQLDDDVALRALDEAVAGGADVVDVGGVKAGPGVEVSEQEEVDRVVGFVAAVRARHPEVVVSVDTWRPAVAEHACAAGAGLVNDTWAGHEEDLVHVAARHGAGYVVSHTGGARPRTRPYRVTYGHSHDGVVEDVVRTLAAGAARAVAAGVDPRSVLVDPTHDFGKNTWHSLALVRRTDAVVRLGFPVLMALSRKDFIGETLDLPPEERLEGTVAATSIAAWHGATVFRTHDARATRRALDVVEAVRGDLVPPRALRGLA